MQTAVDGERRYAGNRISTARMARIRGLSYSGLEHRDIRLGEKGRIYDWEKRPFGWAEVKGSGSVSVGQHSVGHYTVEALRGIGLLDPLVVTSEGLVMYPKEMGGEIV